MLLTLTTECRGVAIAISSNGLALSSSNRKGVVAFRILFVLESSDGNLAAIALFRLALGLTAIELLKLELLVDFGIAVRLGTFNRSSADAVGRLWASSKRGVAIF